MPSPPTFRKVNPADQPVLILSVRDRTRASNELQTIVDTLLVPRPAEEEAVATSVREALAARAA